MNKTPHISIITVGMNHLEFIKELLKSIYIDFKPKVSFEMIYIDNCSSDDSVDYIKKNYPNVIVHKNKKVKGFGTNNNLGVSFSKGKYIAIVNPDIKLLESAIDKLYEYLELNPKAGIIVPQLLNADYSYQYSVRSFVTLKVFFWRLLSKGIDNTDNKVINHYLLKNMDIEKIQYVDWALGAFFLISKSFFEELKGFDETYFLYLEDEDLCYRSWKKNRPVIYYPKSKVIHNHLRGSSNFGKKTFLHIKSYLIFFMKNGFFIKSARNKFDL